MLSVSQHFITWWQRLAYLFNNNWNRVRVTLQWYVMWKRLPLFRSCTFSSTVRLLSYEGWEPDSNLTFNFPLLISWGHYVAEKWHQVWHQQNRIQCPRLLRQFVPCINKSAIWRTNLLFNIWEHISKAPPLAPTGTANNCMHKHCICIWDSCACTWYMYV